MRRGSATAVGPAYRTAFAGVAIVLIWAATGRGDLTAATLLLAAAAEEPTPSDRTTVRVLVWIGTGAALGGALAWLIAGAVDLPVGTDAVMGLGVALGGGLGAVGRLLTADDVETESETVTVTAEETGGSGAALPTGDDLFETHPDPVLYFTETDAGVVVRAANPAFEDRFGISTATASDTPLSDALMTAGRREELAAQAAREGIDRTVTCETIDGEAPYRLRSVRLADERTRGYVLFTPADASDRGGAPADPDPAPD